ncbi:hypothetical protein KIN20_002154 [Parelaphostrongylus tenuis]|uniref:Uncharacterized protein n=1 Tax=Parelaphostrongylus tenuis TaxID=148309 RepID=A0AAD5MN51_PARTN|nr:hypothetical protein KIN20_002154 [Parelaphostrongylus tenuis]
MTQYLREEHEQKSTQVIWESNTSIMDSPPDFSPNAPRPPTNFDDTNAYLASLQPSTTPASNVPTGQVSADGFGDTSGPQLSQKAPPAPSSVASTGQASSDGSEESGGFEKVDHDVLEEYGQQFVNQMQQALFGKPPEGGEVALNPRAIYREAY